MELLKDTSHVDEHGNLKSVPFKFLIGHRSLLLKIPKDLNDYLSEKSVEKVNTETDPAQLKVLLLERIQKYGSNRNLALAINIEDITNFSVESNRVRCSVKCQFCPYKTVCFRHMLKNK